MQTGRVILLNGISSSGKTSIAKELQASRKTIYLHCSLDMFWNMTPTHILASSVTFPALKQAMACSVKALVETGHNVIVDAVLRGVEDLSVFKTELASTKFSVIKIYCPLEVAQSREVERGDRKIGLAEAQYEIVHHNVMYDFEVNTANTSAAEAAESILMFLYAKAGK